MLMARASSRFRYLILFVSCSFALIILGFVAFTSQLTTFMRRHPQQPLKQHRPQRKPRRFPRTISPIPGKARCTPVKTCAL